MKETTSQAPVPSTDFPVLESCHSQKGGEQITAESNQGVTLQILFDTDRATITEAGQRELQKAVAFVKKYPGAKIEVDGHTDSVGPEAYNMKLSETRAAAVKDYLIKEAGVDSSKVAAIGFREAKPVADNKTAAGRAQNRRVEILVLSD